jgi:hypothetical protein
MPVAFELLLMAGSGGHSARVPTVRPPSRGEYLTHPVILKLSPGKRAGTLLGVHHVS